MIRQLSIKNISCIVPVLEEWQKECNGKEFKYHTDLKSTMEHLMNFISSQDAAVYGLFDAGVCVGFIGVFLMRSHLSKDIIANEHMWYVMKNKRGLKSIRLLKTIERWARLYKCTHLMLNASYLASDEHDNVCRLYNALGFKPFESTFIKELR